MAIKKEINILVLMLVLVVSLNFVSSYYADWNTYGGESLAINNMQNDNAFGNFNSGNITTITTPNGFSNGNNVITEPVVSNFGSSNSYSWFQSGNYTEIYDKNGILLVDSFVGKTLYDPVQAGLLVGSDPVSHYVAGIWKINATWMTFNIYRFNTTNNNYNLVSNFSFTLGGVADYSNGVRCISGGSSAFQYCNTLLSVYNGSNYDYNYFRFYFNGSYEGFDITHGNSLPQEPLSYQDANGDGLTEYLFSVDEKAVLFNQNGVDLLEIPAFATAGNGQTVKVMNARFFKSDTTPNYRILMTTKSVDQHDSNSCFTTGTVYRNCLWVSSYRTDGTPVWAGFKLEFAISGSTQDISNPTIYDFNHNGIDDIFLTTNNNLYGIRGNDGVITYQRATPIAFTAPLESYVHYVKQSMAFLDGGITIYPTFITTNGRDGKTFLFTPNTNTTLFNTTLTTRSDCVPADTDFNGFQEVICLTNSNEYIFTTNSTNTNPTISSITLNPSSTFVEGTTLQVTINATDAQGDVIQYSALCGNGFNTTENFISTQNCPYANAGIYNLTVQVRDGFHSNFNTFSTTITVTSPSSCNFNNICEVGLGENVNTCPSDCTVNNQSTSVVNNSQLGNINTITIPSQLVDTSNPNSNNGLLPEIYFGMVNFFSHSLSPLILIVFIIFLTLTMLALGLIIKRIFQKVADLR